jgi:hypothetical protein
MTDYQSKTRILGSTRRSHIDFQTRTLGTGPARLLAGRDSYATSRDYALRSATPAPPVLNSAETLV